MRIAYRGNFDVPWTTETHIAGSLELLGHEVVRVQEGTVSWADTIAISEQADFFLWTSTWGLAHNWDQSEAWASVEKLNGLLPTAAMHLDKFWGLGRSNQVREEPWFHLRHCFTADGDHQAEFASLGVNHHWLPPGVYEPECVTGTPRDEYASAIAFVGAWQHYGHAEHWPDRQRLLGFLRRSYRGKIRLWPRQGAVRGQNLNDLYASVKIVVGDSCLAKNSTTYTSDRVFETPGRGGFLIYPYIPKVAGMLIDGEHVRYYPPGGLRELKQLIDYYLVHDEEREKIRQQGQAHVRENHTYTRRCQQMLEIVYGG